MEAGTVLGHYQILSAIGKGGMGEVWRARDNKLGREVAIKTLPEEFAHDADRLARIESEAKLLALLNHPNIAAIYGLEESRGTRFLVLELIEGETLADRLRRGAIPVTEALKLALQVALALEAAHGKGVIHRDLKPANIKVTPDGKVKVLDFGLAKEIANDESAITSAEIPTLSLAFTQQGVILGTPAYMSPERTRAVPADRRADTWAFGCVLFEMLSGHGAFHGQTISDLIAAVLARDPEWDRLPPNLHPRIRLLIERCLEKDIRDRSQSIVDARVDLQRSLAAPVSDHHPGTPVASSRLLRVSVVVLALLLAGVSLWSLRQQPSPPTTRDKYEFPVKAGDRRLNTGQPLLAISHDGFRFAFAAADGIYTQSHLEIEAHIVPGTETPIIPGTEGGSMQPFFSPDGQWIGYWDSKRKELLKVPVSGGEPKLVALSPLNPVGPFWCLDDTIVFGQVNTPSVWRVSANGGEPAKLFESDAPVFDPEVLPDGKTLIYTKGIEGTYDVVAHSLATSKEKVLFRGNPVNYLSSGHLVYGLGTDLLARTFDPDTWEFGSPVTVEQNVLRVSPTSVMLYGLTSSGSLIYASAGSLPPGRTLSVREASSGSKQTLSAPPKAYLFPSVSPDERRVAVQVSESGMDQIWIYDLSGDTEVHRLTYEGHSRHPAWQDDQWVIFESDREGPYRIYRQRADGNGKAEPLTEHEQGQEHLNPAWSGGNLYLTVTGTSEGSAIGLVRARATNMKPEIIINGPGAQRMPAVSRDGSWIAYSSQDPTTLQSQIWVEPLPPTGTFKRQITSGLPHSFPVWSRDKDELYFIESTGSSSLMSVAYSASPTTFEVKRRSVLSYSNVSTSLRLYDLMKRGRILTTDLDTQSIIPSLVVVRNWMDEVKSKFPRH